jgi:hypothetical protein
MRTDLIKYKSEQAKAEGLKATEKNASKKAKEKS